MQCHNPAVVVAALACLTLKDSDLRYPVAWRQELVSISDEKGPSGAIVNFQGAANATHPTLSYRLAAPVGDTKLVLSVWLRGDEDGQWASIDTKACRNWGSKEIPAQIRVNPIQGFVTTQYVRVTKSWKLYTKSLVVSRSASALDIAVSNLGRGPLQMGGVNLQSASKELCDLDGPGVLHGFLRFWVKEAPGHGTGQVSFPVPLNYQGQVPLAMKLSTSPAGALQSYSFSKRGDGINWLCTARLKPGRGDTSITWEALTFVDKDSPEDLPRAESPSLPVEAVQWLPSTACVQAVAPSIVQKARELSVDQPDIETYARRVIRFTCDNRGGKEPWSRLDAVASLTCAGGGSCTNRANLAAALLRAKGIPARTIAHLPTWSLGEPLFTHWLVEYWHPGRGWVRVESTWGEFQPPAYTTMLLAISSVEDENLANSELQARWVLPGAPVWSLPHIGADLIPSVGPNQQANWVEPAYRVTGSRAQIERLLAAGRKAHSSLMMSKRITDHARYRRVETAAATGDPEALRRAIER